MKRHAVITGLGIVSPIGIGIERFWAAALAGRSGIGPPTLFDASKLPRECQIVGEVKDFDVRQWMPGASGKMAGRFSQFAVAAAKMAREDARLDEAGIPPERLKVAIGTSMNGLADVHQPNFVTFMDSGFISPWTCLEYPAHAASSHVAMSIGARGQATTLASACAAGVDAIAWAAGQVEAGAAVAAIAGASDTPLSPATIKAFHSVGVLPRWDGAPHEASRPFDRLRAGMVLAEGAAVVVVEEERYAEGRGAHIYARIAANASATESTHLRKVDESGSVAAWAMAHALKNAGIEPRSIDYIAAHGNSMTDYDAAETAAIKRVLGNHAWNVPASSLKSMCGQALAASSAMQVVAGCLTLRDQVVPPTINYAFPDPACDLDYVANAARRVRIRHVLIHAHSLGGLHSAMVLTGQD
jgi:3-oxoacyl-[acyl-carrier-protein] synthase II